jgi:4a-hydroxytetrahydrobiopterin dehydratase
MSEPNAARGYPDGMTDQRTSTGITPDQFHAAEGTEDWRVLEDGANAYFRTSSYAESARLVGAISDLPGLDADRPRIDVRAGGVTVRLLTRRDDWYGPSERDVALARQISGVARELGAAADPTKVQSFLVIPGALDTPAVMPFWRALLGYEPRPDSPEEDLIDPQDRGPSFWFEGMNEPRADGLGAIHVAVWVPPEHAEARVAAALAAGGRLVRDHAPAWWTLADAAGNEADIATTMGRG